MRKVKKDYLILIGYLLVILLVSIITHNSNFLIIFSICFTLLLTVIIYRRMKFKRYIEIIDYYNSALAIGKYDEILEFLKPYQSKYYIKVLKTNLYLYKGDEETYLKMYNSISKKGKERWFYYKLLHFSFDYYQFLVNDNKKQIGLDDDFPINQAVNYFNNEQYDIIINLIEKMPSFTSGFMNYIKTYIYLLSVKNIRSEVDSNYLKLEKLTMNNKLLQKHFQIKVLK